MNDTTDDKLDAVPFYMDLGARAKARYRFCPAHLKGDVDFFLDNGYVVLKNGLPKELVERANSDYQEHKKRYHNIYAPHGDEFGYQCRITNLHMAIPSLRELFIKNQHALELQDFLFGRPSSVYSSLTFEKGTEQSLHRDSPYFTTNPEYYYLGVWTALEAVDHNNGQLMVVPRGHLLHEVDRFEIFEQFYNFGDSINHSDSRLWNGYQLATTQNVDRNGLQVLGVPMDAGDVLIWHPHLPHGGSEILDKTRTRMSIVMHVVPEAVPIHGMDVFFGNRPPLEKAQYPVIFHDGRAFMRHNEIEFAHVDPVPVEAILF